MAGRQRGFAITTIIGLAIIASLAATAGLFIYRYNHAISEAKSLREQLAAEHQRAAEISAGWASTMARQDEAGRQKEQSDAAVFSPLQARALGVHRAAVVVSAATAKLFADSDRAARFATAPQVGDGPSAAPPAVPEAQPDTASPVAYDERELAEWKVADDAAYVSVFNKWNSCVATYNDLRLQEQLHQ